MIEIPQRGRRVTERLLEEERLDLGGGNKDVSQELVEDAEASLRGAKALLEVNILGDCVEVAYNSMRRSITAVLNEQGIRVRSGDGAHASAIEAASAQFEHIWGGDTVDDVEELRRDRNASAYAGAAQTFTKERAAKAIKTAENILTFAQQVVENSLLPLWGRGK